MLLRALKYLLRAAPALLGLVCVMYLVLMHGQRLAVDGYVPLASVWARLLLCIGLALVALVLRLRWRRRAKEVDPTPSLDTAPVDTCSERERALRERLHAWFQRAGGTLPGFFLVGPAGLDKGPLLGLTGNADDDLRCTTVSGFALFDINGSLVNQAQAEQAKLWRLLLDELKQAAVCGRLPRGIVLVLPAVQLQKARAAERDQLALILRARLEELASRFGHALPVHIIMSGCEQLPGYTESLAWLAADQRELSLEFPPALRNRELLATLGQRMRGLIAELDSSELERLQREPDVQVRSMLFGFTPMWRALSISLQTVLETALAQERGIAQVALQSVRFSAQPATVESPAPVLLRALHTCRRPGRLRTPMRLALAWCRPRAHYLVPAFSLMIGLLLLSMHRDQTRRLEYVDQQIAALQQASSQASMTVLDGSSLRHLDRLAHIARMLDRGWLPWTTGRHLQQHAAQAYAKALEQRVLVDLLHRLQDSLRSAQTLSEAALRQSLSLYLMLGGEGRFDAQALGEWYANASRTGVGLNEPQRRQLDEHLQQLFKRLAQSAPLPLDPALIEQARNQLAAEPVAQRLYRQLLERLDDRTLREFSIASVLGAGGLLLFTKRSGESQTRGVPGLYTVEGHRRFSTLIEPLLAVELVQERRLMGQADVLAIKPIKDEVLALYHQAYIEQWEAFFDDLQIAGLDQTEHLPRRLLHVAQADSPLLELLRGAARHTQLSSLLPSQGLLELAVQKGEQVQQRVGLTPPTPALAPPVHPVTQHFKPLHQWLAATAPASTSEQLLGALKDTALFIDASQRGARQGLPIDATETLQRLREEVEQLPLLVQPVLLDVVEVGQQHVQQQTRHVLEHSWASEVSPFCERALSGRYPFYGDADTQVALEDFNRLFAADGVLQRFMDQHLDGQLDTHSRPWRLSEGASLGRISAPLLASLEHASQLRNSFFPNGQPQAQVTYELSPLLMSERIASFSLDYDGTRLNYSHGPLGSALFEWPGKALGSEIRATVTLLDGRTLIRKSTGPWAWFRLIDQARQMPTQDPETRQLVFDFEGNEVHVQVRVSRVGAPFDSQGMRRFDCAVVETVVESIKV
uniref:type VI secretion system membrane subunit TssM n=1 Tax=Pseudomonas laurentiana TaxID=2364649 RepID=UPI0029C919CF|nr:type VI secretion system membrane subunit TssM [Pseudomonas laurentiana]